jgi:MinD superfamily P-loop ATPase
MKRIVVLSGKGGTGKTFVSASLASLAENTVFADCDVDAANLHLLFDPKRRETHPFTGGKVAMIDPEVCTGCDLCIRHCRFDAIAKREDGAAEADPVACEGCGVCGLVCPVNAVSYRTEEVGEWYLSDSSMGTLVHARLNAGAENSGKLVQQVRERAVQAAGEEAAERVLIDGPPGTGCPVFSAVTGVDYVLLVTEPTTAGIHDLRRVVRAIEHFEIPAGMVINKATIAEEQTEQLRRFAGETGLRLLGEIPYRRSVVDSLASLQPYPRVQEDEVTAELRRIWQALREIA